MKQAAEMALVDIGGSGITLSPRIRGGSSAGAQTAAQAALDEGAELILGPLLAAEVAGRQASRNRAASTSSPSPRQARSRAKAPI